MENPEETPQESAEEAQASRDGATALQWTGDNLEAIKDLLGDAYDRTRGGLQADDPIVVWFWTKPKAELTSRTAVMGRAQPGDWIIRLGGDEDEFVSKTDDEFTKWTEVLGKE